MSERNPSPRPKYNPNTIKVEYVCGIAKPSKVGEYVKIVEIKPPWYALPDEVYFFISWFFFSCIMAVCIALFMAIGITVLNALLGR